MKQVLLFAFLFICSVTFVRAAGGGGDEEVNDPDVIKLTTSNFNDIVDNEELMLVEFYAPWCGHCKRLAPEFAKAATTLLKNNPPVKLGKVDATIESSLGEKFEVRGYPTLKVFRNGKDFPYSGPRDADGIVAYMKKQVGPAAKPITTVAEIENLQKDERFLVLGLFKTDKSQLQSAFVATANKLREDYIFLKSSSDELFTKYGVSGDEAVLAVKTYDDLTTTFDGKVSSKAVEDFVVKNSIPLVGEFTEKNHGLYAKRGLPIVKLFTSVPVGGSNNKQLQYYVNRLKAAATHFADKVVFALAEAAKFPEDLEEVGSRGKKDPVVLHHGKAKYLFTDKFNADNIKTWVQSFLDGKAERYIKSEPVPADNSGPVKVVVGKTFDEIVMDDSKDVLIEFYAPWCGHCKKLEPAYNKLGEQMAENENVVIAKIDATANDYNTAFEVSGFPTIYFKPAKANAKPMKYEGKREVSDFVAFIKKNAASKIVDGKKGKKSKKNKREEDGEL